MRISALSRLTGVPIATIKFYLRERLLPPGTPTKRNQADYGDEHVRRLRFIRMLTTIGQLELSAVRQLLASIETNQALTEVYATVHYLTGHRPDATGAEERVRTEVDGLLERLGWRISADTPDRIRMYQVLGALRQLGCEADIEFLLPYARSVDRLAGHELGSLGRDKQPVDHAAAAARAILFDAALTALSHMAREHHATQHEPG